MAKNKAFGKPIFPHDDTGFIPEIMTEQSNPWKSGKGMPGVDMDGNQRNGRHGSPFISPDTIKTVDNPGTHDYQRHEPTSETDGHIGVNWDNTQPDDVEDNAWESSHGIHMKAEGHFKDIHNGFEAQEVDLRKHIKVVGMPDEAINGNSSTDCYGG